MGFDNGAPRRPHGRARKDLIADLKSRLEANAVSALAFILTHGKLINGEFCCGDIAGNPGESWKFTLKNRKWKDWSREGERGGVGVFDAYVAHFGGDVDKAIEAAVAFLALDPSQYRTVPEDRSSRSKSAAPSTWIMEPPPVNAPPPSFRAMWAGSFKQAWEYKGLQGERLQYVARYESGSKKDTPAITWGHHGDGVMHWRAKGGLFVLFGLELLGSAAVELIEGLREVWVFEGEKTACRARELFPDIVCLAWKGGVGAVRKIDFAPLAGCRVRFVADRDDNRAGQNAMQTAARRTLEAGAVAVAVVEFGDEFADGWDVADFNHVNPAKRQPAGWTLERIRAHIEAAPWHTAPIQPDPDGDRPPKRSGFEVCEPSFTAPSATVDEAAAELHGAMEREIFGYLPSFMADRRRHLENKALAKETGAPDPEAPLARQIGIAVDMAVGKTHTAIVLALKAIEQSLGLRILYAVPSHVTGKDVVTRFNDAAGQEIARRWSGADRPDPDHPGKLMCWRPEDVKAATNAYGTMQSVCGSKSRGFCPFHEKGCGDGVCGVRRQALAAADPHVKIWVVPHAMLDKRLPAALDRPTEKLVIDGQEIEVKPDPFDLVFIDESPWSGMFGGQGEHSYTLPLEALMPEGDDWTVPMREGETPGFATSRLRFLLTTAHSILSDNGPGWVIRGKLRERRDGRADLTADLCREARRLTFRLVIDPDTLIDPEDVGGTAEALAGIAEHNRTVFKLARLWELLALIAELPNDTDRSPYLRIVGKAGKLNIVMAWKEHLHESILALPILYLDGTMNASLASHWLERLDVVADIKAKTPACVTRRQVGDRAIGYRMVAPSSTLSAKDNKTARNNVGKLARVLELRAAEFKGQGRANDDDEVIDVAAIVPMATDLAMKEEPAVASIPRLYWNNQRGSDRFRAVRYLQIVSRPLPKPAAPEMLAWLTTGKVGDGIPEGEFYPQREAGLLMRDGTGRKVLQYYHPDPVAEAWRWQMCEGEVLQGEARGRAKRRNPDAPLLVEIIGNTPLPLEIDEVVTAESILEAGHPLAMMIARDAVFEDMDGIGRACADLFRDGVDIKNAAKEWYRRNPERDAERKAFVTSANGYDRYRYRPLGRRKAGHVLVHVTVADPLAHVQALVGPCDVWAPAPITAAERVVEADADLQPMIPAEEIHEPAAYEPEEIHEIAAISAERPEIGMISLDTAEGMAAFKRALHYASLANAASRAAARRDDLAVWVPDDPEDLDTEERAVIINTVSVIGNSRATCPLIK
jgi:hypothetical protein